MTNYLQKLRELRANNTTDLSSIFSDPQFDTLGHWLKSEIGILAANYEELYESIDLWLEKEYAILEYCQPHLDQMWAATITAIILDCHFSDAEFRLREYQDELPRKTK